MVESYSKNLSCTLRCESLRCNLLHVLLKIVFLLQSVGSLNGYRIVEQGDIYFEIVEPATLQYTFKVRPAQGFGVSFNSSYLNVGLVLSEPSDGCSVPTNKLELPNNLVLMDRGGCSFLSKCIQAERSGVLAVIICDNDIYNDDQFVDMIDDSTKRNCSIPAMFLLGKDGYMIKKSLNMHNLTRAIINIPINVTYGFPERQKQPPWVLW